MSPEGPTKLKLTWNEPRTTGGSPITGYFIQVSRTTWTITARTKVLGYLGQHRRSRAITEPDDGTQTAWKIDDPDTREYIYQGLMPADARWFRVIALNAVATVDVTMISRHARRRGNGRYWQRRPGAWPDGSGLIARCAQWPGGGGGKELQPDRGPVIAACCCCGTRPKTRLATPWRVRHRPQD